MTVLVTSSPARKSSSTINVGSSCKTLACCCLCQERAFERRGHGRPLAQDVGNISARDQLS